MQSDKVFRLQQGKFVKLYEFIALIFANCVFPDRLFYIIGLLVEHNRLPQNFFASCFILRDFLLSDVYLAPAVIVHKPIFAAAYCSGVGIGCFCS